MSQNASIETPSAPVIAAHPTRPDVRRLNERMPTSPLIAAPMPGRIGINQIKSMSAFLNLPRGPTPTACPSRPLVALYSIVVGPHPHDLCLRDLWSLGDDCGDDLLSAANRLATYDCRL